MATVPAYIFFPPVQPVRFIDPNKVLPMAYNLRHFDDFAHRDSMLPFQDDPNYAMKIQTDDITWIQVHHNLYDFDVRIVDADGVEVYSSDTSSLLFKAGTDFAGNVYDAHGTITPVPLHTSVSKITWASLASLVSDRVYFIEFRFYTNLLKTTWIDRRSEPIYYKTKHYNTFRIDYSHATNDYGVFWAYQDMSSVFNRWSITFQKRLDGYLEKFEVDGADVFYEDQMTDLRQLSSRPFRKQTLYVGSGYGISDYDIDKVWRILSCSYTLIDGKRFTKEQNAKMEITPKDQEPLKQSAILLREYWGADAGFVNGYYTVDEAPSDGGYDPESPFIPTLILPTGRELALTGVRTIADDTEGAALAEEITHIIWGGDPADLDPGEELPYSTGLYGEMNWDDTANVLHYVADLQDEFTPVFAYKAYSSQFTHTVSSDDSSGGVYAIKFKGGGFIVDWGDGSDLEEVIYSNTDGTLQAVMHTYPAGTTDFDAIIYHDSTGIVSLELKSAALVITAIGGDAPSSLEIFSIEDGDFGTEFNFDILEPAKKSLHAVTVKNCGISLIDTTSWADEDWTGGLSLIDFSENALDTTALDAFTNDTAEYPVLLANGTLNLKDQDPLDYVSTDSDAAREYLTGLKWEILVDLP